MRTVAFLIFFVLIFATFAGNRLSAGLGYSRLEQRFVMFESDTLAESDELRGFVDGQAKLTLGNNEITATGLFSGGSQTLWGKAKGNWQLKTKSNLVYSAEIGADTREPIEDSTISGFVRTFGYLRLKKNWGNANGGLKLSFEQKKYSGNTKYSYDYSMTKLRFDFGFPFLGNDELTAGYQFSFRYAPDTLEANNLRNNFYASWETFAGRHFLMADFEAERRFYNRGNLNGNFWWANVNVAPRFALSNKFTFAPTLSGEGYRYDWASETYPNREIASAKTKIEFNPGSYFYTGIAPKYLISHALGVVTTDNYSEISVELSADLLKYKKIWFDLTLEPGVRIYKTPPEDGGYYSDYTFVEANALFAYWIFKGLRLDAFFTYSPEWHKINEDDITTLYISTNLKYEFFE